MPNSLIPEKNGKLVDKSGSEVKTSFLKLMILVLTFKGILSAILAFSFAIVNIIVNGF